MDNFTEETSSRMSVYNYDQLQADILPTNLNKSIKAHDSGLGLSRNCLAGCSHGRYVVSGGTDKSLKVWNFETGVMEAILLGLESEVLQVKFHPTQ